MKRIRVIVAAVLIAVFFTFDSPTAVADSQLFEISELSTEGRVVSAHLGDFDGDRRKDLMLATLDGIPPDESRTISVYLQRPNGSFAAEASHTLPIPRWSAVYDFADLRDTPGEEMLLLRPSGVTILSLADASAQQWDIPIAGPSTVGAADDERGFEPFRMVFNEIGEEPLLLVPQIGAVSVLTADGAVVAQIAVGRRANFFVTEGSELLSVESDIQLFLDVPKLSVGDVDGNGLADIVAATRHEIRVFLRDDDGGFADTASYTLPLNLINRDDHTRGSGSVVTTARDFDNDGLLDLMVTHVEGSFVNTVTSTYLYRNRDGRWDIDNPDDSFIDKGALSSDLLLDVDSDGTLELVRIQLKFSVLEIVELLLTRELDARITIHRLQDDGLYNKKPWSKKKVGTALSFETFRPKGFMPTGGLDLNADGLMDFITSANGKGIEVYLGDNDGPFGRRTALQRLPTAGIIRFADFDADGLPDFVLYDTQSFDTPIRIGRNLGNLPGSLPSADAE